eukprot:scaffold7011_cov112-Isochrysis_galbana.AAC.26
MSSGDATLYLSEYRRTASTTSSIEYGRIWPCTRALSPRLKDLVVSCTCRTARGPQLTAHRVGQEVIGPLPAGSPLLAPTQQRREALLVVSAHHRPLPLRPRQWLHHWPGKQLLPGLRPLVARRRRTGVLSLLRGSVAAQRTESPPHGRLLLLGAVSFLRHGDDCGNPPQYAGRHVAQPREGRARGFSGIQIVQA